MRPRSGTHRPPSALLEPPGQRGRAITASSTKHYPGPPPNLMAEQELFLDSHPVRTFPACAGAGQSRESAIVLTLSRSPAHGERFPRREHQRHAAEPPAHLSAGPGRLERFRRTLRPAHLWLVPALGLAG